jgi:hypothetical protein
VSDGEDGFGSGSEEKAEKVMLDSSLFYWSDDRKHLK